MSKWLLMSVMIVPILLGLLPARRRSRRRLAGVVGAFLVFDLLYLLVLYSLGRQWA